MTYGKYALFIIVFLSLFGCSSFMTADTGGQNTYVLSPVDIKAQTKTSSGLMIAKPLLASGLNNERIALMRGGIKLDYFAGAKWSDNLGLMIQDRMTQSMQQSGGYKFVIDDRVNLEASQILVMDIQEFYVDFGQAAINDRPDMKAKVTISVKLIATKTRSIQRQFTVRSSHPVEKDNLDMHAKALDLAFRDIQTQIIQTLR